MKREYWKRGNMMNVNDSKIDAWTNKDAKICEQLSFNRARLTKLAKSSKQPTAVKDFRPIES